MIYILIFVVAMLFSAFFSSAEIAYTSLNVMRLENLAEEGKKAAKCALKIRNSYDFTLSSLLIGNDLVNIAMSSCATVLSIQYAVSHQISEGTANTIATVLVTIAVLIFGEITPKIVAKRHALGYAIAIAYPLRFITLLFAPISKPVSSLMLSLRTKVSKKEEAPTMTEDELSTLFETAEEEGIVDEEQGDLLQSAMDYQETTVEEIMKPRTSLEAIDIEDSQEAIQKKCLETPYSRLPVFEGSIDHIVGILHVHHYLKEYATGDSEVHLRDLLITPYYVHKTSKLPNVLKQMRKLHMHMAIVMDEYGGTMGIVTMEDILEEIVGDIWDENDKVIETNIVKTQDHVYEVKGTTPIADFFEELQIDDKDFESEYTTMGGWAVEMLEEDPHEGDHFEWKNLYVIVSEMKDHLVSSLIVRICEE